MNKILRPMKAAAIPPDGIDHLPYPLLCTPKIDGIRAIVRDSTLLSYTLKPIPNQLLQSRYSGLPEGFDGELWIPHKPFQLTTSAVMSREEKPHTAEVVYLIFDWYHEGVGYRHRLQRLSELYCSKEVHCEILKSQVAYTAIDFLELETEYLSQGYEGICARTFDSPYKFGRSTLKQGWLLKLKRFIEEEATITGFEEGLHNANPAQENNFGLTKRSSHQENKIPNGMLGALVVFNHRGQFNVGTGFTQAQRQAYWDARDELIGKKITVRFLPIGMKDLPRHPVFKGFRDGY